MFVFRNLRVIIKKKVLLFTYFYFVNNPITLNGNEMN